MKIAILGLGYVGLPLLIEFSKKYNVLSLPAYLAYHNGKLVGGRALGGKSISLILLIYLYLT